MKGNPRITVDGALLTAARIEAGMSMDEVSDKIGCNKSSLSRWEQGTFHPHEDYILKLVSLYCRGDFVKSGRGGNNG